MARVTTEDCMAHINNRFALVMVAAKRTKQLLNGANPYIESKRDKAHVLALREIAAGKITLEGEKIA